MSASAAAEITDPATYYLSKLGPDSKSTMAYVLQEIADRLGYDDSDLTDVPWNLIDASSVVSLKEALLVDGKSLNTIRLYVSAVRGVMNGAWALGHITRDQLDRVRAEKAPKGSVLPRGKNIKRQVIRELIECCEADERPQGKRDAAIFAVLYGTGMRKAESVNITISNINFDEKYIQVLGKGNKQLQKFAPNWVFEKIRTWIDLKDQVTPGAPHLFSRIRKGGTILNVGITKHAIYHIVKTRALEVGITVMPHDFRRSFITRIIDEHDLAIAQKMADHASIGTTSRYDMRGDDKKRAVVDGFNL
jgi:integrase/recombinase XerC